LSISLRFFKDPVESRDEKVQHGSQIFKDDEDRESQPRSEDIDEDDEDILSSIESASFSDTRDGDLLVSVMLSVFAVALFALVDYVSVHYPTIPSFPLLLSASFAILAALGLAYWSSQKSTPKSSTSNSISTSDATRHSSRTLKRSNSSERSSTASSSSPESSDTINISNQSSNKNIVGTVAVITQTIGVCLYALSVIVVAMVLQHNITQFGIWQKSIGAIVGVFGIGFELVLIVIAMVFLFFKLIKKQNVLLRI
jgi:hypothetical protein